jgi:hypothetical protein
MAIEIKATFDLKKFKKQYEEHASKCEKIVKEVNKWGQKTKNNLSFLKPVR